MKKMNRKKFLFSALTGTAAFPLLFKKGIAQSALSVPTGGSSPLVIATWDNRKATDAAMQQIQSGKSALDAVEAGARIPEADPEDNSVGYGGYPDRDGNVTLDACIMDHLGNAGSVSFLQHIKHPISVARLVMEKTQHVMLSGEGALRFALDNGFKKENLLTDKARKAWQEWTEENKYQPKVSKNNHDTIGILAIDANGNISGACSTSGRAFKMHGRVGDSPIIGAGMYVDNEAGGACATGVGEHVMKTVGSFLIVELMRYGLTPQEACKEAVRRILEKIPGAHNDQVGFLAVNKNGEHGAYSIRPTFPYALYRNGENKVLEADFARR